jgi:hypothetical protein
MPTRSFAFLSFMLFSHLAFAVLGEKVSSFEKVQKQYPSSSKIEKQEKLLSSGDKLHWTVYEIDHQGTEIREYANADGKIFAVSWRGLKRPDLSLLLGSYYKEFSQAEKKALKQRKTRSSQSLESPRLIARKSGHMRDLRGMVYLKELWPAGLNEEDLQ